MYSEKLVTAVKHNGRVLRETGDTVHIPFGSEYSILIKNKNSARALVRVEIDGVDATEGTRLIVPANGSIDLERFIKEGNMDRGNRFKFIERTKKIEDGPRGIGAEDGLVRVEFEFEREPTPLKAYQPDPWWNRQTVFNGAPVYDTLLRDTTGSPGYTLTSTYSANSLSASSVARVAGLASNDVTNCASASFTCDSAPAVAQNVMLNETLNDVGITVPGSVSDQKFTVGAWFPTDGVKHVVILKLLGEVGGKAVQEPVTVKAKPKCTTCGTTNKANAKFCRECGTALTIV